MSPNHAPRADRAGALRSNAREQRLAEIRNLLALATNPELPRASISTPVFVRALRDLLAHLDAVEWERTALERDAARWRALVAMDYGRMFSCDPPLDDDGNTTVFSFGFTGPTSNSITDMIDAVLRTPAAGRAGAGEEGR